MFLRSFLSWIPAGLLMLIFCADAFSQQAERPRAWIQFREGDLVQEYESTPYLWLGRTSIGLEIAVDPQPEDQLALLWGAKNDAREMLLVVNGDQKKLRRDGDYSGFQWLVVPMSQIIDDFGKAEKYEIGMFATSAKEAFLSEVRLITSEESLKTDLPSTSKSMTFETTPPVLPEVFPEMRDFWDTAREPENALPDESLRRLFAEAEANSRRAHENFYRCRKFVEGWLEHHADSESGLIPRNINQGADYWNAKDAAADNYPFMVLTAALTDREMFEGRMRDMLETEIELTSRIDRLPDTYSFSKNGFLEDKPNLNSILFGGSEYVKDGLLPMTEWLGPSPWSDRMLGIVDDIWKHANVETPYGKIPTNNIEVHGEMLQSLSRIYWMTGEEEYLDWAIRLGDYYLLGGHHPTRDQTSLRLRDHGCEIVSGLCELYAAVHFAREKKAKAYRKAIHAMCDNILEYGRNEEGMLWDVYNPQTGEHSPGFCDTWGYNYNGIYTVYLLDEVPAYRQAVVHVLSQLEPKLIDYNWGNADSYADSIEGGINLYNREPIDGVSRWLDSEIREEWAKQQPNGVIEGWHGDGNTARTAIMYALWKTQGTHLLPWRDDVCLGAVEEDGRLMLVLRGDEPWRGKIYFDRPRHRDYLHLPIDYPRINQFPEWFTVEEEGRYEITDVEADGRRVVSGKELLDGIPAALEKPGLMRWVVRPCSP